jgi:hypothetical protein
MVRDDCAFPKNILLPALWRPISPVEVILVSSHPAPRMTAWNLTAIITRVGMRILEKIEGYLAPPKMIALESGTLSTVNFGGIDRTQHLE